MFQALASHTSIRRYPKAAKRIIPLALADALILLIALALVYTVRTNSPFFTNYTLRFVLFALAVTVASLYAFGGYHRLWAHTSGHEVTLILMAAACSTSIVLLLDFVLRPRPLPLSVVAVGHLLAVSGNVAIRYRSRLISGLDWRWRAVWKREFPTPKTRVLIVGAGEAGQITALRLKHRYHKGHNDFQVVGYVDDDLTKQNLFIQGVPVLATCDNIGAITQQHDIDLIVLAIHNLPRARFRQILDQCEHTEARIKIVPDVMNMLNNQTQAPLLHDVQPEDLLGRQPISWHNEVDASAVTGKIVLVTGAAGSIGSELCRQMITYQPVSLIMLDNNESGLHDLTTELQREYPEQVIHPILADITHRDRLDAIFARYRPQLVYHSAAYKHVPLLESFPDEAVRVNVQGTINVAQMAQSHRAERFVLISTDKAVNPSSVMGASKRVCELFVQALGAADNNTTVFAAVRFGNVLGSRGSVVPTFSRQINEGGPVTVTDQNMVRYFISIPEAVNLVIHAACLTSGNDLFMLRMGDQVPIVELAERMIRLRGLRPYIDVPIVFTGTRPGEKLAEELHTSSEKTHTTIHPDIVRLNGTHCHWTPEEFIAQISCLDDLGTCTNGEILEQLRTLAQSALCDDDSDTHLQPVLAADLNSRPA